MVQLLHLEQTLSFTLETYKLHVLMDFQQLEKQVPRVQVAFGVQTFRELRVVSCVNVDVLFHP